MYCFSSKHTVLVSKKKVFADNVRILPIYPAIVWYLALTKRVKETSVLFSHGSIKAFFWYLIHVERQKEMITVSALTSRMTPLKTIRATLASAIFRQYTYLVVQYKINLHSLRNLLEKLVKGSFFYLFLKLAQINCILANNLHIFPINTLLSVFIFLLTLIFKK